jgi:predicted glycoside hydrolase/deacetylase ChbG (UPF0249 family)
MMRRLIVNADDFGHTPGVTEGILKAHREGIVTSTTAMMNLPHAQEALRRAAEHPRLGVGVHLNSTYGRPLLPSAQVSTLLDEKGIFLRPEVQMTRASQINPGQVRAEWRAQVEVFKAAGREPDHVDCHHSVHVHPAFFAVYLELAEEYHLPVRMPIPREEDLAHVQLPDVFSGDLPAEVVRALVQQDLQLLRKHPVGRPDHFLGDFMGGKQLSVDWLLALLPEVRPGVSELMTHPGLADAELLANSSYAQEREREMAVLCDPRVGQAIRDSGIELVTFEVLR